MGGYAEGNNHRTFYEENPDNSVITVPTRGYGNDVLKYIEEHKMLTQSKISENTRKEENKNEVFQTTESNESSYGDIMSAEMEAQSITHNPTTPYYVVTNDDVFSGYRLQDDEYLFW